MSFSQSSKNLYLEGSNLHCESQACNGSWHKNVLNLNDLITNNNGNLEWQSGGNFAASSQNLRLEGKWLHCDSRRADGSWNKASINLDDKITNSDGHLKRV